MRDLWWTLKDTRDDYYQILLFVEIYHRHGCDQTIYLLCDFPHTVRSYLQADTYTGWQPSHVTAGDSGGGVRLPLHAVGVADDRLPLGTGRGRTVSPRNGFRDTKTRGEVIKWCLFGACAVGCKTLAGGRLHDVVVCTREDLHKREYSRGRSHERFYSCFAQKCAQRIRSACESYGH